MDGHTRNNVWTTEKKHIHTHKKQLKSAIPCDKSDRDETKRQRCNMRCAMTIKGERNGQKGHSADTGFF